MITEKQLWNNLVVTHCSFCNILDKYEIDSTNLRAFLLYWATAWAKDPKKMIFVSLVSLFTYNCWKQSCDLN